MQLGVWYWKCFPETTESETKMLSSCYFQAQKKTEDDIFKPSDFNWESLTEDITSPELK